MWLQEKRIIRRNTHSLSWVDVPRSIWMHVGRIAIRADSQTASRLLDTGKLTVRSHSSVQVSQNEGPPAG